MPNYVENRIRLGGDPARIHAMLETIQNDKIGIGSVDFNKIIPMPESLNIEAGSRTDRGLKAYRDFIQAYALGNTEKVLQPIPEETEAAYLRQRKGISREEWTLGKAAWNNLRQYGALTWYEWCIQHWGTKWNACGYDDGGDYHSDDNLTFQTAWSAPHPILNALAERFPEIEMEHRWADEDIGQNCGRCLYQNGSQVERDFPQNRKEAVEFACGVWETEPADHDLRRNQDGTGYDCAEEPELDDIASGQGMGM